MEIRPIFALPVALMFALGALAGCASSGGGSEKASPEAPKTGFGKITTGGEELKKQAEIEPKKATGVKALADAEKKKADEIRLKSPDKYKSSGALFRSYSDDKMEAIVATLIFSEDNLKAGGKATVYFGCSAEEADVSVPVAVQVASGKDPAGDKYTGGSFTCGHNKFVEGSFEVDLEPTDSFYTGYHGLYPAKGYYVIGMKKN